MRVLYPGEFEFGALVFVKGGKPENPEKKPQSLAGTNNKLNRHIFSTEGS